MLISCARSSLVLGARRKTRLSAFQKSLCARPTGAPRYPAKGQAENAGLRVAQSSLQLQRVGQGGRRLMSERFAYEPTAFL
jgi:hypothetical protein